MAEQPLAVLLVDDDPDDRLLTRRLLHDIQTGAYELTESTYELALQSMTQGGFDACLLD